MNCSHSVYVSDKIQHWAHCSNKQPSPEVIQQHRKLIRSTFKAVFHENELKPMKGKPMKILLRDEAVPVALTAPKSIPFAWKEKIKKQLDQMLQDKIIAEVTEPTDWCHPMRPVPKKESNDARLCVDFLIM